jgi:hypothetical protein
MTLRPERVAPMEKRSAALDARVVLKTAIVHVVRECSIAHVRAYVQPWAARTRLQTEMGIRWFLNWFAAAIVCQLFKNDRRPVGFGSPKQALFQFANAPKKKGATLLLADP